MRIKLDGEHNRVWACVEVYDDVDGITTINIDNGTHKFQQLKLTQEHKFMLIDALNYLHPNRRA